MVHMMVPPGVLHLVFWMIMSMRLRSPTKRLLPKGPNQSLPRALLHGAALPCQDPVDKEEGKMEQDECQETYHLSPIYHPSWKVHFRVTLPVVPLGQAPALKRSRPLLMPKFSPSTRD